MLTVSLDQYIVVVALPEIGRELGYSSRTLQSVISACTVASSGFLLLGGRAADLLGRRRIFVSGLAFYAGASLGSGLATTPEVLLAARAVQGIGGALVFPATGFEPTLHNFYTVPMNGCVDGQVTRRTNAE
jgi:MFS family permease